MSTAIVRHWPHTATIGRGSQMHHSMNGLGLQLWLLAFFASRLLSFCWHHFGGTLDLRAYNPQWRSIAKRIGIDTVVAKVNSIINRLQKFEAESALGEGASKGAQILLSLKYQELARQGITVPFADVEF